MKYAFHLHLLAASMCLSCTSMDSRGQGATTARSEPLIALAKHVATTKGAQRYALSIRVYCGHPAVCGPSGDSAWDHETVRTILESLGATTTTQLLRAPLVNGTADMVIAFGPIEELSPDARRIIVRHEHQGGARIDRAWLKRRTDGWQVDSIETVTFATRADTLFRVR